MVFCKADADFSLWDGIGERKDKHPAVLYILAYKLFYGAGNAKSSARKFYQKIHAAHFENLTCADMVAGKVIVEDRRASCRERV